jgi:hypothetical protein
MIHHEFAPDIPVGTVLSRPKGLSLHRGIYLGNGLVYESTWKFGARLATFSQFAAKRKVKAEKILSVPMKLIYQRVKASLGRSYNPLTNNCDHAIARIEGGAPRKSAAGDIIRLAALAMFVALVLNAGRRPRLA